MSITLEVHKWLEQGSKQCLEFVHNFLTMSSDLPLSTHDASAFQSLAITAINTRLGQSETRADGLNLLLTSLPICTAELLSKHFSLWFSKATRLLESPHSSARDIDISSKVISKLVILCKELPDLQKQVSMQHIKQVMSLITNMEPDRRTGGIYFIIATFLYHYREPCERLQASIKSLILPLLDSNNKTLVQAGANCLILLAKATERSFKPPIKHPDFTSAVYHQALLCNDLHSILDELFSQVITFDSVDIWGTLDLPSLSQDDVVDFYNSLQRRFQNLCVYLATMLKGCAGRNSVSCSTIITLICRGLAITPDTLQNEDSHKRQILYLMLPKIQMSLLDVLNAFITGFSKELIPFALTILQLYRQALKWIDKDQPGCITISGGRTFRSLKIAVYKSLQLWLMLTGNSSGIDMILESILPYIIKDITPEREQVLLTIQKSQNMSKKALKKLKDSQYLNSPALATSNHSTKVEKNSMVNSELCMEALILLQKIFYNSGVLLEPVGYRHLQKLIVPLLLDVYMEKDDQSLYRKESKCRLNLLKLLGAIQMNPNPLTPPPTHYSVQIFQMAMNDGDEEIVEQAKTALAELEKIVHPSAATLDYPQTCEETTEQSEVVSKNKDEEVIDRIRSLVKDMKHANFDDSGPQIKGTEDDRNEDDEGERNGGDEIVESDIEEVWMKEKGPKQGETKGDEDIEIIENEGPPLKKHRVRIVEDIRIPGGVEQGDSGESQSVGKISQNVPESCSQDSYGSGRGESDYFTIKDAQRVSGNSSVSSDQPVEIVKESSKGADCQGRSKEESDDEAMLSMFCDQIKSD